MLVKDVMSAPAVTIDQDATVKEGLRLLDRHHVTALPVVTAAGRLVGVVSEADLLHDVLPRDPRPHLIPHERTQTPARSVQDVMTTLSLTVAPDSDLAEAADLMTGTAVKSLPVVDAGRVVGVVSRSDIVHLLARADDRIRADVDDLLRSADVELEVDVEDGHVLLEGTADPHVRRVAEVVAGAVEGVLSVRFR